MRTRPSRFALPWLLAGCVAACSPDPPRPPAPPSESEPGTSALLDGRTLPAAARPDLLRSLREAEERPLHASDGGGRAHLESPRDVEAGSLGSFPLRFEAGPHGIGDGGAIVLQVSPFWGWSDPQTRLPEAPGFTTVATDAPGVRLETSSCGGGCLRIGVEDASLPAGAEVAIVYGGEGAAGARVDRFAEQEEEFFFRVDGDGDGVAAPLAEQPQLAIEPGPAASLRVLLDSTAPVGAPVTLRISALDRNGNAARELPTPLEIVDHGGLEGLPRRIAPDAAAGGHLRLEATPGRPGVMRVRILVPAWEREFRSNPLLAESDAGAPRILWADLHGHTGLSDGTGTPEDYFRYARDTAGLDVAAITDHDHWGLRFLDRSPSLQARIRRAVAGAHEPGRFVALLGFEWTNWLFGHRHVIYFGDDGPVLSSIDRETDEPEELWAALEGREALTVAHHPGGGPVATDWSVPPDPRFEPVTEIVSVHGSSECQGCPAQIYDPVAGAFVQDALARGHRLGFVGSGDTHDGHPGLGSPNDRTVGLTALLCPRLDRASVLEALRRRRVYATSGARILLRFAVEGAAMGGEARITDPERPRSIYARVIGTGPIDRLDFVTPLGVAHSVPGEGREELEVTLEDPTPAVDGAWVYARVVQVDGSLAWSSPIWLDVTPD